LTQNIFYLIQTLLIYSLWHFTSLCTHFQINFSRFFQHTNILHHFLLSDPLLKLFS
jgi:hypothetical protein